MSISLKFYKIFVQLAMLYDTKYWATTKPYAQDVNQRDVKWTCGQTYRDKIRNEGIKEHPETTPIRG